MTFPIKLVDADHALSFTTQARLCITAPQLALGLSANPANVHAREAVTWTLTARNLALQAADTALTVNLPFNATLVSGTLTSSANAASELSGTIKWQGILGAQAGVTLTYQAVLPLSATKRETYGSAIATVADEVWQAGVWINSQPYAAYLPVLRK